MTQLKYAHGILFECFTDESLAYDAPFMSTPSCADRIGGVLSSDPRAIGYAGLTSSYMAVISSTLKARS
jgi:hypothetical protein